MVACPSEELLGAVVDGRYTLTGLLGRGGFGAVFRAEDRDGPSCAIKLIPFVHWTERALAQREASLLEEHAHPGLVAFHRAGRFGPTARGFVYIAMELGAGSLDDRLRSHGVLHAGEIRALIFDLLDALDHLHARGVVHGDVKPGNLVRVAGRFKLCDLGSAMDTGSRADRDGFRSGTPEIAAPEVWDGEIGPPADLWSLGLLLHTAATGRSPFPMPSADPEPIARVVRTTEPRIDPALPEPFAAIVRGCLQRDQAARWTSAEVRAALEAVDLAPPAPPPRHRMKLPAMALAGCYKVAARAREIFTRW